MNKGVLQSSSPVQPMMAGGNPNWWWNVNGIRSPPSLPPPAPPVYLGAVAAAPSNLFHDQLYVPTVSGTSSSSSSSSSWQDMSNPELPESWSQLLLGGLVGEDHKSGNTMSHFQDQQSPNISSSEVDHVKQGNSARNYDNIYGHPNIDQQDFRLGSAGKPPTTWSHVVPNSTLRSTSTTSMKANDVLEFSKNKPSTRHPPRDRAYECDSNANGGAQKKARVQRSSGQSTFKVRKEKLGDRITTLHQIVSPFGKTDTASVLSEAIGYIRFLQTQIEALSSPYLGGKGSGNPRHPISEEESEDQRTDLKSRGLCLVPISCTLEVEPESNIGADYWAAATSTFGDGGLGFH